MQRVVNGAFNNQAVPQQCCRRAALRGPQTHGVGVVQCAKHRARTVKTQGYPEQSQLLKLGVSNPVDLQSGGGHQERSGYCHVEPRWQCGRAQRRIVKQAKRLAGLKHRVRRIGLRVDSMRSRLKIVELKTPLDHHRPPRASSGGQRGRHAGC